LHKISSSQRGGLISAILSFFRAKSSAFNLTDGQS